MKPIHAALIAALVVLPSCGSSTEPAKEAVQIALSPGHASGSAEHPLTFHGSVSNLGLLSIWHYQGCGAGNGIHIDYYDSNGNLVLTKDPYAPQPACGDELVTLAMGGKLETASSFDGTLYGYEPDPADRRHPAPGGRYRAVATFTYFHDPAERHQEVVLAQSVDFDWDGPESTEVTLSGSARESCVLVHHFVLSGRVLNSGSMPVWYPTGCNEAAPIQFHLFDPNGVEVVFRDPTRPPCSSITVSLAPGDELSDVVDFDGYSYVPLPGGGYDRKMAPEGRYTVRVEYRFARTETGALETATHEETFLWSNAVTCGT